MKTTKCEAVMVYINSTYQYKGYYSVTEDNIYLPRNERYREFDTGRLIKIRRPYKHNLSIWIHINNESQLSNDFNIHWEDIWKKQL